MRKILALTLLFLCLAPAQALKLTVWDKDLSNKLAAGESVGGKLNMQVVKDYSGPVIAIFSQSDDEKKSGQFAGLLARYDGLIKNGQLSLLVKPEISERSLTPANTTTSPPPATVPLTKLLQPFKLSVVLQPTSFTPLPGSPFPDTAFPGELPGLPESEFSNLRAAFVGE